MAVVVAGALMAACGGVLPYYSYRSVPRAEWNKNDTLTFADLPSTSDSGLYDFYVELRTTADFPYTTIHIGVLSRVDSTAAWRRDTLQCSVRSGSGRFGGRGFTLHNCEALLFRRSLCEGAYPQVRLFHIMRREDLPGVGEVGLKMVPVAMDHR